MYNHRVLHYHIVFVVVFFKLAEPSRPLVPAILHDLDHGTCKLEDLVNIIHFIFYKIPLLGSNVSPFTLRFPQCKLKDINSLKCRVSSQLHSVFVGFMCLPYLYVYGPLDFHLVIQILLSMRLIFNMCVHRPDLSLTSHPKSHILSV